MCLYFKNESVNFPFSQYGIVFSISIFIFALDLKKKILEYVQCHLDWSIIYGDLEPSLAFKTLEVFLNLRKSFSANGSQQVSSTMVQKNWKCMIYNQPNLKKAWLTKLYMAVQKLANCSIRNLSITLLSLEFGTYFSCYSNIIAIASTLDLVAATRFSTTELIPFGFTSLANWLKTNCK